MSSSSTESAPLGVVIFSKDRPLQLDSTLASLLSHCKDPERLHATVLYTTSSPYLEGLYRQLSLEYEGVRFCREQRFRQDVLELAAESPFVGFVVDDAMFVRDFAVREVIEQLEADRTAIAFSLRLGTNTTYCYTIDAAQEVPGFAATRPGVLAYRWPGASNDFGYPFDLSSSVYRTADIEPILRGLRFANPNTMEGQLAARAAAAASEHPTLLCFERSAAFCIPANLVQNVAKNRVGARAGETADALAEAFERGDRIDIGRYEDFPNVSCHQDVELYLRAADPRPPTVSVIVPCYGQAEFLGEAVASVIAQTWTDWEIVIVDDGSPDDTAATAQRLIEQHPDRRIRLLSQANQGVSVARNNGIAASTGRYILPLDADDMLTPLVLQRTVALLEADRSVSIAYTDYQLTGTSSEIVRSGLWDPLYLCAANQLGYCGLYRRGVWAATGGYNPRQKDFEDYDFWLACLEIGVKAKRIPEPLFLYRARPGTRTDGTVTRKRQLHRQLAANHPTLFTRRLRFRCFVAWKWRGFLRRARSLVGGVDGPGLDAAR